MDCSDASDENSCDEPMPNCPEGEFKCRGSLGGMGGPGGRCVLMRYRCDGDNDCGGKFWSTSFTFMSVKNPGLLKFNLFLQIGQTKKIVPRSNLVVLLLSSDVTMVR